MRLRRTNKHYFARSAAAIALSAALIISSSAYVLYAKSDENPVNAVYVSPDGNDGNDGTIGSPFATVAGARDYIRNNRSSLSGGVTVYLKEGTYKQESTLEFTELDSGSADFPIVYKAYDGADVSIDGGKTLEISGFTKPAADDAYAQRIKNAAARSKVIMYDLKSAGIDYTSSKFALYYDGVRGKLSRYPNEQFIFNFDDLTEGHRGIPEYSYDAATRTFYDKENVVKTWASVDGVKICGNFEIDWASSPPTNLISYDASTNRVKIASVSLHPISGRFYYSNIIEEIDIVGEYYVTTDGILYFCAPENYEDIKISVPVCENALISINSANYITLDGLTIENGCDTLVNVKANDVTVENSIVRCGYDGISLNGYRNTAFNNEVYHIGAEAIGVKGGDITYLIPSNSVVSNNNIHDFGDIRRVYASGVYAEGVGFEVTHNEIYRTPHAAVQSLAMGMRFEYNYLHDACYEAGDAGTIYDGTWRGNGNLFANNIIANITNTSSIYYNPNGYYCDDGGGGKTFVSNLLMNIDGDAIFFGGGPANMVKDNIIVNSSIRYDQRAYYPGTGVNAGWTLTGRFATKLKDYGLNWGWMINGIGGYATESWSMHFPWTMRLKTTNVVDLEDDYVSYAFSNATIRNNVVCGAKQNDIQNNVLRLTNFRDNLSSYSTSNVFADFENGDYTVNADAKVFHDLPGFKPCDVANVGIQEVD